MVFDLKMLQSFILDTCACENAIKPMVFAFLRILGGWGSFEASNSSFFLWISPPEPTEIGAGTPGETFPPSFVKIRLQAV